MSMLTRVAVALCLVVLVGCTSDDADVSSSEPNLGASVQDTSTTSEPVESTTTTEERPPPVPELSVPDAASEDVIGIAVGGFVVEVDGLYLLCESLTEDDPPGCGGESLEISNGEVIDPIVFVGDEGSRYSDAEVVVTGDVVDGVLTIR